MNYQVRRRGEDLGSFSLEELRQQRATGVFIGNEYVQREGRDDWQPLDLVLKEGYRESPPPLPTTATSGSPNGIVAAIIILGAVACGAFGIFFAKNVAQVQSSRNFAGSHRYENQPRPAALAAASKKIVWNTNTLTSADSIKRGREFRVRQWLDGYKKRGDRNPECDARVITFLETWLARNYGGAAATNKIDLEKEGNELAGDPNFTDPLALTIIAVTSLNHFDAVHRLEHALEEFPQSEHAAYPKFYAAVLLARSYDGQADRVNSQDALSLQLLKKCFADGSFQPGDQQEIAEILVNDWGVNFFNRKSAAVCKIVRDAGKPFQWLSLVLDGDREIAEAWRARGGGYANTVSDEGWKNFNLHLTAASTALTDAWHLQPDFPIASYLMIYVSLGDSDITEMRQWFDRALAAQVDYPGAWKEMRWGLRPRWYGDEASMLALGKTALDTGRFDTDVPRKFFDCVADVESEEEWPAGQHIYGRSDLWPEFQRMYEGYIAAPSQAADRDGWRTSFAAVAYFAGKYDVARAQLEALDWKPLPADLTGWGVDLSLMPLEVAARTGSLGQKISTAEFAFNHGNVSSALKIYSALNPADADARTAKFIQVRLAALQFSQRLQGGAWVDFLPQNDDPNWVFSFGSARRLPDGALEVESGPKGHMLFSRTRFGANFQIKGQFEVVHSANKNFQGGVVMGVPDLDGYNWYGFRLKRRDEEGDVVSLGLGWSREQITRHVALNDVTNSFDFTFQNGRATARVNGSEIFNQAAPSPGVVVPDNSFMLGLGAFNDSTNTVIRYRNVQVRKLN